MKLLPSVVVAAAVAQHCEVCENSKDCGENMMCATYEKEGEGESRCVCKESKSGVYGNLDGINSNCEAFCKFPWTRRCLEEQESVYDVCGWEDTEESGDGSGEGSGSGDGSGEGSGEGSGDPYIEFCDAEDELKCIDKLGELSTCFYDHNGKTRCVCDEGAYYSKRDEECVAILDECTLDADCEDGMVCEETEFKGQYMNKCMCTEGFGMSEMGSCEPLCGWGEGSGGGSGDGSGEGPEEPEDPTVPEVDQKKKWKGKWGKKKRGRRSAGKGKPDDPDSIWDDDYEVCHSNATCITEAIDFPECVCNEGFYGNGEKCESIQESCDDKCIDRYSEFHQCVVSTDGNQFSCECIDGYVVGSDPKSCIPAPTVCEFSEDCYAPYLAYNLTEIEAAERVMCVGDQDGETSICGCTLDFPYVDQEGLCVDEREDPEDPEIPTCETKKCKEGAICVEESGEPECVCDEANGYVGNGGRCWLDEGVCGVDSFGSCGHKYADFPVGFKESCAPDIDAVNPVSFNTVCMPAEGSDNKRDGCCECAPGFIDANGDPTDGCEEEALGCEYNADFCHEDATCEDLDTDLIDASETDIDPTFLKQGFMCVCNDGFFGKGYGRKGCREKVGGGDHCEKWGYRCGENAVCTEIERKPFIDCSCQEGFEGLPPNCVAVAPSLSVQATEDGASTCDQLDTSQWFLLTSKKPDFRLSAAGDETSYTLDITNGAYNYKTPMLNGKAYSGLIEFGAYGCGADFIQAFAKGQIQARVIDTVSFTDKDGNEIDSLYEVVDVTGYYVSQAGNDKKSKAYVQFTKKYDSLGQHMGYTTTELADMRNRQLNVLERNQEWKSRNGWVYVKPNADTVQLQLTSDLPVFNTVDPAKCFTPDRIRFFLYAEEQPDGKLSPMVFKNANDTSVSVVDCFYQSKMNFEDYECDNKKTECEWDELLEEEHCMDVNQTLFEALFEATDEINDKSCITA